MQNKIYVDTTLTLVHENLSLNLFDHPGGAPVLYLLIHHTPPWEKPTVIGK